MLGFDVVVVGCGLSGSILAREIANKRKKRVRIVERRNHIGGNVYDEVDSYGIRIQRYGPHTFHTNKKEVYEYIAGYAEMIPYQVKCSAIIDGIVTPSPFNFTTIEQFYEEKEAKELIRQLKASYKKEEVPITELLQSDKERIRDFATLLFEKDYRLYTAKQWGIPAEEIDASVLKRVPVLLSYRDYIYREAYEALPKDGFTNLIASILNHERVQVTLGEDAISDIIVDQEKGKLSYRGETLPIIFTGAIDELFGYRFGRLPYRSLDIKYQYFDQEGVQDTTLVVHPQEHGYTRTTEYTKLPRQKNKKTVIGYEYPCEYSREGRIGKEPYYPVITKKNQSVFEEYKEYARQFKNLTLCGRLADYKYYNMDQAIAHALGVYEQLELI